MGVAKGQSDEGTTTSLLYRSVSIPWMEVRLSVTRPSCYQVVVATRDSSWSCRVISTAVPPLMRRARKVSASGEHMYMWIVWNVVMGRGGLRFVCDGGNAIPQSKSS